MPQRQKRRFFNLLCCSCHCFIFRVPDFGFLDQSPSSGIRYDRFKFHLLGGGITVTKSQVFDPWSERYDRWFESPIGKVIRSYEAEMIADMLKPSRGDRILDAGCGTGIFTRDLVGAGAWVVGLELSFPMLLRAQDKLQGYSFMAVQGNMLSLPFEESTFDKSVSITAIEFIKEGREAVDELFRVTRPGGLVVVATLNRLSTWATRRIRSGKEGHSLFQDAVFRSPGEMARLSATPGHCRTAIHFEKQETPEKAREIEKEGQRRGVDTGAFLACVWQKT